MQILFYHFHYHVIHISITITKDTQKQIFNIEYIMESQNHHKEKKKITIETTNVSIKGKY